MRREYYLEHKDEIRARARLYYQANKERINAVNTAWAKNHPERRREISHKSYLKYKDEVHQRWKEAVTKLQEEVRALLGDSCAICGRKTNYMSIHHLQYKTDEGKYHKYKLLKQAKKEPSRFLLLCGQCHAIVTFVTNNPQILKKLIRVIELSERKPI